MRIIVVGATGTIGTAVADALASRRHDVVRASRTAGEPVDLTDPASIDALFARVGRVDGVVSCAGHARYGRTLAELTADDVAASVADKLVGNVELVRRGARHVADRGVFVLTAGIWGREPPPAACAAAIVNGGLEAFARAAAVDLPRGIRIVTISPPLLTETAQVIGGVGVLTAAANAEAYVDAVEGTATGRVVYNGDPVG
jgi:NAD(P)-dependent dehydrogenase (short-subunit alcohol dehydrogenase family)